MSGGRLPELNELGARLAEARAGGEAEPRRRRPLLPRSVLALALVLALAVPALAGRPLWAPLADGETPLPAQAPPSVRTELARAAGPSERWRLVAYRARLRGGGVGTCLFLTVSGGGTGACGPDQRRLLSASQAAGAAMVAFARVGPGVERVAVRWSDGAAQRVAVRVAALRGGGSVRFAIARRRAAHWRTSPPRVVSVRAEP